MPRESPIKLHIDGEFHFTGQDIIEQALMRNFIEVKSSLPQLAEEITIRFTDENFIPETGESGYTQNPHTFIVAIDTDYPDKEKQQQHLRETVFHEALHAVQGYTGETGPFSGIESAIYEGMAMAFGREMTGASPLYGDYSTTSPEKLREWFDELKAMTTEQFGANDAEQWRRWAFYDDESGERWRLYKVGAWLLDEYLAETKKTALDLIKVTPKDVLESMFH